jgi:hypothetical protein
MGATVQREANGVWILRIAQALRKEELDAVQAEAIKGLSDGENIKLLVIVGDDFKGWVGTEEWSDVSFFSKYGDKVVKIAIVGDSRWEDKMMMFAGAGFRRAPVKYFQRDRLNEAQSWLS